MGPKSEKRLHNLFNKHSIELKRFVIRWYGHKCKDFNPDCICCKKWKLLEELIENPFDKK